MHSNLYIEGIPEGWKREKGIKNVFERIMTENLPNLKKEAKKMNQETYTKT